MDHVTVYQLVQTLLRRRIWDFGRHELVHISSRLRLIVFSEDEENVGVWQATFLKLHYIRVRYYLAKDVFARQLVQQSFELAVEHARYEVWSVRRRLTRAQICLYFRPIRIRSSCNEQVWAPFCGHQRHRV